MTNKTELNRIIINNNEENYYFFFFGTFVRFS